MTAVGGLIANDSTAGDGSAQKEGRDEQLEDQRHHEREKTVSRLVEVIGRGSSEMGKGTVHRHRIEGKGGGKAGEGDLRMPLYAPSQVMRGHRALAYATSPIDWRLSNGR